MTRLQKKCLVVSLCFHGVVLGAFVVTAAFRSEPTISEEQILTLIPAIVDSPTRGGERGVSAPRRSNPAPVTPTSLPTRADNSTPRPAPITHPLPKESQAETRPTPPKVTTARSSPRQTRDDAKVADSKSAPEAAHKHVIVPDLTPNSASARSATRSNSTAATAAARARAQADRDARVRDIESAIAALSSSANSTQSGKVVALPGMDSGEAFVNYRTAIYNIYYHAWTAPDSTGHRNVLADVKIVVSRDGSIISSEFVSKSGDSALDHSVQRALDSVKSLPPFPAGAADAERTFIIRFNPIESKDG